MKEKKGAQVLLNLFFVLVSLTFVLPMLLVISV